MKKYFLSVILLLSIFICSSCDPGLEGGYRHPKYKSDYTPEQHVQKITELTEAKFAHLLESGELVDIRVETLYAFYDDDPEYFLITLEFAEELNGVYEEGTPSPDYSTKYMHTIGYIEDNEYMVGLCEYDGIVQRCSVAERGTDGSIFTGSGVTVEVENWWRDGRSAYDLCGLEYTKKYYGSGIQAVKTSDGIVRLYNASDNRYDEITLEFGRAANSVDSLFSQRIISESEYKNLMKSNYKMFPEKYAREASGFDVFPAPRTSDIMFGLKFVRESQE